MTRWWVAVPWLFVLNVTALTIKHKTKLEKAQTQTCILCYNYEDKNIYINTDWNNLQTWK